MTEDVVVWGERITLQVSQRSAAVWTATGEYMGVYKQTTGRSPRDAAGQWKTWAHTKGG